MADPFVAVMTGWTSDIYITPKKSKKFTYTSPDLIMASVGMMTTHYQHELFISQLYIWDNGSTATVEVVNTSDSELKFRLTVAYLMTAPNQGDVKTIEFKEVDTQSIG